jgi:hypothetical protein
MRPRYVAEGAKDGLELSLDAALDRVEKQARGHGPQETPPIIPTSPPFPSKTSPSLPRRSSTSGFQASRLEDGGNETEDGGETGTGGSDGLVGSTSEGGVGRGDGSASANWVAGGDAGGRVAVRGWGVHWGAGGTRGGAVRS